MHTLESIRYQTALVTMVVWKTMLELRLKAVAHILKFQSSWVLPDSIGEVALLCGLRS